MKLTHEAYGVKITIETDHDELDINDMVTHLRSILFAARFHIDTINEVLEQE